MKIVCRSILALLVTMQWVLPAFSQSTTPENALQAITQRLENLERQNSELQQQISALRRELEGAKGSSPQQASTETPVEQRVEALEEKVDAQAGRLDEQNQVTVQSSQRLPIRLTGMALFNAFKNTHYAQANQQYGRNAQPARIPNEAGASLRQTIIGLEFQSPYAIWGGAFKGTALFDLYPNYDPTAPATNAQGRLRLAYIEGRWKNRSIVVGQDKPVFSPREPNSLAQVGFSPLTAAGNLYQWLPQIDFEQRLQLGSRQEIRAEIGAVEIPEDIGSSRIPAQFVSGIEKKRPALEGHFQFGHRIDEQRRVEVATGFHTSSSHVLGMSIPSKVLSVDWFWNPVRRIEFTGTLFSGENLSAFGGGALRQSFTFRTPRPGQVSVIPVRSRGGWGQLTFLATSRLSFNLQSGADDPNNRDLPVTGIARNSIYVANMFYRLAPNVVTGVEAAHIRTLYMAGPRPTANHYDLYFAYMF